VQFSLLGSEQIEGVEQHLYDRTDRRTEQGISGKIPQIDSTHRVRQFTAKIEDLVTAKFGAQNARSK
jgi:hypothetical protein